MAGVLVGPVQVQQVDGAGLAVHGSARLGVMLGGEFGFPARRPSLALGGLVLLLCFPFGVLDHRFPPERLADLAQFLVTVPALG